jgi:hypothetical protein
MGEEVDGWSGLMGEIRRLLGFGGGGRRSGRGSWLTGYVHLFIFAEWWLDGWGADGWCRLRIRGRRMWF